MSRFFFALLILFSSSSASAKLIVKLDCYLVAGPIDCQSIRDSFFSSIPYLQQTLINSTESDLTIKLRSFEMDRRFKYIIGFEGKDDLPSFTLIDLNVLKTFTSNGALLVLLGDLQKGIVPYLKVVTAAETKNGVTTLAMGDPARIGGPSEEVNTTGWYLNLNAKGSVSSGTISSIWGSGNGEVNFSNKGWRFNASTSAYFQKVIVDLGDGTKESQEAVSFGGRVLIVKTLHKGWSIAAIAQPLYDPRNNLEFEGRATAGLEWDLVPFLKENDHSLGTRYKMSAVYQNYSTPNVLNKDQLLFAEHALEAYLTWHFDKVDVSGSVSVASKVDDLIFSNASASGTVTWRITNNLALNVGIYGSYRHALINQPAAAATTDALQQLITGGNYANFTYGSFFSITYTLGNSTLNRQDQRWHQDQSSSSSGTNQ